MLRRFNARVVKVLFTDVMWYTAVLAMTVFFLWPIIWLFITSIKPKIQAFEIPPNLWFWPTLENYRFVLNDRPLMSYLRNSIIITVFSVILTLTIGLLAAYSLARFQIRGKEKISFWIISTRMLPPVAVILPIYLIMSRLNLMDTHVGLILLYTAFNLPYAVWLLRGFLVDVPVAIEEAAMVDGCSRMQVFRMITLPLAAPGIAVVAVFCMILSWNEFMFALSLTGMHSKTLPVLAAAFMTDRGIRWAEISVVGMFVLLPAVTAAVVLQRNLTRVFTFGAVTE